MLRLMVVGEGPSELGEPNTWERDETPAGAALPTLVHRVVGEPAGVSYHKARLSTKVSRTERKRHKHMHRRGVRASERVKIWIDRALRAKCDGVVVLWDRDGDVTTDRLAQMEAGRDEMEADTSANYPPCAVGVAIESFDAWMIADGAAVGQAEGDSANSHPSPEGLGSATETKARAKEIFGNEEGLRGCYAKVAEHVDLNTLARCCPEGFAPFREDIKQRIGPLLQET